MPTDTEQEWEIKVGGVYAGRDAEFARTVTAIAGDTVFYKFGRTCTGEAPKSVFRGLCRPEDHSPIAAMLSLIRELRDALEPRCVNCGRTNSNHSVAGEWCLELDNRTPLETQWETPVAPDLIARADAMLEGTHA